MKYECLWVFIIYLCTRDGSFSVLIFLTGSPVRYDVRRNLTLGIDTVQFRSFKGKHQNFGWKALSTRYIILVITLHVYVSLSVRIFQCRIFNPGQCSEKPMGANIAHCSEQTENTDHFRCLNCGSRSPRFSDSNSLSFT